jgi:hypothetical protein
MYIKLTYPLYPDLPSMHLLFMGLSLYLGSLLPFDSSFEIEEGIEWLIHIAIVSNPMCLKTFSKGALEIEDFAIWGGELPVTKGFFQG